MHTLTQPTLHPPRLASLASIAPLLTLFIHLEIIMLRHYATLIFIVLLISATCFSQFFVLY